MEVVSPADLRRVPQADLCDGILIDEGGGGSGGGGGLSGSVGLCGSGGERWGVTKNWVDLVPKEGNC